MEKQTHNIHTHSQLQAHSRCYNAFMQVLWLLWTQCTWRKLTLPKVFAFKCNLRKSGKLLGIITVTVHRVQLVLIDSFCKKPFFNRHSVFNQPWKDEIVSFFYAFPKEHQTNCRWWLFENRLIPSIFPDGPWSTSHLLSCNLSDQRFACVVWHVLWLSRVK